MRGCADPRAQVLITVPSCPCSAHGGTGDAGRIRANPAVDGPARWSPTAPSPSTGSWSTPATGRRWKSGGPATASQRPCASGCGSATAGARSRAVTTRPWTTTRTTSWPGPTGAPPGSPTSASPAANTTASNTLSLDTGRGQQRQTTRLDLTLRTELSQRTAGLGTTPLATRHPENVRGPERRRGTGCSPGTRGLPRIPVQTPVQIRNRNRNSPEDPFPDWDLFTAGHPFRAAGTDNLVSYAPLGESALEAFLAQHA